MIRVYRTYVALPDDYEGSAAADVMASYGLPCTVTVGLGREGFSDTETTVVVESYGIDRNTAIRAAKDLRHYFNQERVLLTWHDAEVLLV